jgi:hypothetical protein
MAADADRLLQSDEIKLPATPIGLFGRWFLVLWQEWTTKSNGDKWHVHKPPLFLEDMSKPATTVTLSVLSLFICTGSLAAFYMNFDKFLSRLLYVVFSSLPYIQDHTFTFHIFNCHISCQKRDSWHRTKYWAHSSRRSRQSDMTSRPK